MYNSNINGFNLNHSSELKKESNNYLWFPCFAMKPWFLKLSKFEKAMVIPWLSCTTKSFFKKNNLEKQYTVNLILTSATSSKTPPTIAVECKNKSYGIKPQNAQQITEYYTYHHLIFPRKGWKTLLAHQKSTKSPSWMLHLLTRNISFNA